MNLLKTAVVAIVAVVVAKLLLGRFVPGIGQYL